MRLPRFISSSLIVAAMNTALFAMHFDSLKLSISNVSRLITISVGAPQDRESVPDPYTLTFLIGFLSGNPGCGIGMCIAGPRTSFDFWKLNVAEIQRRNPGDTIRGVCGSGFGKSAKGADYFYIDIFDSASGLKGQQVIMDHPAINRVLWFSVASTMWPQHQNCPQPCHTGTGASNYTMPLWKTLIDNIVLDPPLLKPQTSSSSPAKPTANPVPSVPRGKPTPK